MDIGKKVFFLYPHTIIKEIIQEIVRQEYEAYILEDHLAAIKILAKYKNSILFINIDEILKDTEWQKYVLTLLNNSSTKTTRVGILTYYTKEKEIVEKYLIKIGVQCGMIKIKMAPEKCLQILLKTLDANEAKGRRRYVRALCNEKLDLFNIIWEDKRFQGRILDLSIAGMACFFNDQRLKLPPGTVLSNIQLVLRGVSCIISGTIIKVLDQAQGRELYIIMFEPAIIKPDIECKIHNFIFHRLQEAIKQEVDALNT
ncbi:MAG: PilZ domain-containing protein [Spirochaetales bacterium]|nr:PilZ domain-containing protein [Spirochaetales bacterium]